MASQADAIDPIKAVVIAPGSTGDFLPLLEFAYQMTNEIPQLKIERFATYEPGNGRQFVEEKNFEHCLFMNDVAQVKELDFSQRLWSNPTIMDALRPLDPRYSPRALSVSGEQSQRMSISKVIGDASVIFYWNIHRGRELRGGSFSSCVPGLSNRLVIEIAPTFMSSFSVAAGKNLQRTRDLKKEIEFNLRLPPVQPFDYLKEAETSAMCDPYSLRGCSSHVGMLSYFARFRSSIYDCYGDCGEMRASENNLRIIGVSKFFLTPHEQVAPNSHFVGTWQTPVSETYQPPAQLALFLEKHENSHIIYIGMGSMSKGITPMMNHQICAAIAAFSSGSFYFIWHVSREGLKLPNGLSGREKCLRKAILLTDYVPHMWLFPKVKVVVHHGGAGTTQAALLAGAASVIIPVMINDQAYFSAVVSVKKVGWGLSYKGFSTNELVYAIKTCAEDDEIRKAIEEGQRFMLNEVSENTGVKLVKEALEAEKDLHLAPRVRQSSNTAKCLRYGQKFYLRSENGRLCRAHKGWFSISYKFICDAETASDATPFFYRNVRGYLDEYTGDVPLVNAGFIGFYDQKNIQYLAYDHRNNLVTVSNLGYLRDRYTFALLSTELDEDRYDYCQRLDTWTVIHLENIRQNLGLDDETRQLRLKESKEIFKLEAAETQ